MMKSFLLISLLAASITVLQSATVVYVSENASNDPSCLNGGESQPCSNLTLVLDHIRFQSITEVYIRPGHYVLSSNVKLTFEEVENVLLKGEGEGAVDIICEGYMSGLSFINSSNVSIVGLSFVGCGTKHNSTSLIFPIQSGLYNFYTFFASLYFESCSNIILNNLSVSDSLGIAVQFYYTPDVSIIDSNFTNNSMDMYNISGGVYIEFPYCLPGANCSNTNVPVEHVTNLKYIISGCHFTDNIARNALDNPNRFVFPIQYYHVAFGHGGGLSVFFKGNASDSEVTIDNCTFTNNEAVYGGGLYIEMQDNSSNNNVIMSGNVFMNNRAVDGSGGGAYLGFIFEKEYSSVSNCSYSIEDTHFTSNTAVHGGGLYYFTTRQDCADSQTVNSLELTSCTWTQNKAYQSGAGLHLFAFHGINKGIIEPVTIFGSIFDKNVIDFRHSGNKVRKGLSFGAILTDKVPIYFRRSAVFNETIGSSLVAYQSEITFWDNVHALFFGSRGTFGGAMALYSFTVVVIHENVTLEFINNTASRLGGALYVESFGQTSISNFCFLQYFDFKSRPKKWNASFIFENNTADDESNSIYISSIASCLVGRAFGLIHDDGKIDVFCWNSETSLWIYNNSKTTSACKNQIVTAPSNLTTVYNETSNRLKIIPGQKTFMNISAEGDQGQNVTKNLVLHATSSAPEEVSVDMDINYISNNKIILYQHNTSVTTATITIDTIGDITQQVQLYVELIACPPALTLDPKGKCICSLGYFADRVACFDSNFNSSILRGYWIGLRSKDNTTVVGHCRNCKYTTNNSKNGRLPLGKNFEDVEELLCGANQTGVLCSSCTQGYAPAVNTDDLHCVKCDDKRIIWGSILFIFLDIILPFALLVVIFFSDVPLTSGLLHGPILFGQMITTVISLDGDGIITYESIFNQGATERAEKAYSILYDLFNAEFFMSLQNYCVSENLPYAGIIALQYLSAFLPVVFVVLVAIVFYCRDAQFNFPIKPNCRKPSCCEKFTWVSYFKNSPNALATFILLSYTKIAVITGYLLTPASLWTANSGTSFNYNQLVMYLDGTIEYSFTRGHYYVYFILSMFLGVPFLIAVPLFLFCLRANAPNKNGGFFNHLLHQFQKEFCESLNDFITTDNNEVQVNESFADSQRDSGIDRHDQCCHVRYKISNENGNWVCSYQQIATRYCKLSFYTKWSRHDFRWLAGGFFILRLLLILPYMLAWNTIIQYILQFTVCMIGGVAIIALRPYKRKEHKYVDPNAIEAGSLLLLALLIALSMYQYTYTVTGIPLSKWAYVLQYVLVWIPLMWFTLIYIRLIFKRHKEKIKKCCRKKKEYRSCKKTVSGGIDGELHEDVSLITN